MISLPVVFAMYNRARGADVISPHDVYKAAQLFDELKVENERGRMEEREGRIELIWSEMWMGDRDGRE